jgi:hypothetical protein
MAHAALGFGYNYKSYYIASESALARTQRAHGEMNRDAKANKHDGIQNSSALPRHNRANKSALALSLARAGQWINNAYNTHTSLQRQFCESVWCALEMRQNLRRPKIRARERERVANTNARAQCARRARGFCFSSVAPNLWPTGDVLRAKAARVNYVIICIASAIPLKIHTAIVPVYVYIYAPCTHTHKQEQGSDGVFLSLLIVLDARATRQRKVDIRRAALRDKFVSYCRRRINLHLPNCSFIIRLNYEQLCNCKGSAAHTCARHLINLAVPLWHNIKLFMWDAVLIVHNRLYKITWW